MSPPYSILLSGAMLCVVTLHGRGAQERPQPSEKHPQIARLEQAIAGSEHRPAEEVFKNIQTFKGMPAIRVLRIMELAFVPNLGVNCSYCHVSGQWELDDKSPKHVARRMWVLRAEVEAQVRQATGNDEAVVTCYSCHKGQAKPAFAPGR